MNYVTNFSFITPTAADTILSKEKTAHHAFVKTGKMLRNERTLKL